MLTKNYHHNKSKDVCENMTNEHHTPSEKWPGFFIVSADKFCSTLPGCILKSSITKNQLILTRKKKK